MREERRAAQTHAQALMAPPPAPSFVLRGHGAAVHAVRFHPDPSARLLASSAADGRVRLWDLGTRRAAADWAAHSDAGALNAVWCGGGRSLLTQGRDGQVRLWDVEAGREPALALGFATRAYSFCRCAAAEEGGAAGGRLTVATACEDANEAVLWDARQERPAQRMAFGEGFGGMCMTLAIQSGGDGDGLAVVAGSEGGSFAAWSVRAGRPAPACRAFDGEPVMAAALAPGKRGATLLAASAGRDAAVLRVRRDGSAEVRHRLRLPGDGGASDACVRADGRVAALAGWDRRVHLFEARGQWKALGALRFHTATVNAVDFSHAGALASGSKDGHVAVYSDLFPPPK